MNHWTHRLPGWQRDLITYTSPMFYLGLLLLAVCSIFVALFCLLTNSRTPR